MTQDNALTPDQIDRLTRFASPGATKTLLTGTFLDTSTAGGGIKFTTLDVVPCMTCGALVLSIDWFSHGQWHEAIKKTLVMPVESGGAT